jgi:AcrR family transcriptional regulator
MPKVVPEYKEEAKARIIEAATEMFLENGYKKTKMTEIAKSLGVSKGALYQYFKSKEALLLAVINSGAQFRRSSVFNNMTPDQLSLLSTKDYFDKMLQSTSQIDKFGVEIAGVALSNPELLKGMRSFFLDEVNIIQEYLEEGKKKGIIKSNVDTRIASVAILSFRSGLRGFTSTDESPETIYNTWKMQVDLLLREIMV